VDALAAKRAGGERLDAAPAMPMQITRRIIAERGNGRRSRRSPRGWWPTVSPSPPPVASPAGMRPRSTPWSPATTPRRWR